MRRLFLTMLLATSVATPALAQRGDREGGWNRGGSSERVRPQRAERAAQEGPRAEAPRAETPPPVRQMPVIMRGRSEGPARGAVNDGFRGNPQSGPRAIDPAAVQQWRDRRGGGGDNRGQVAPVATTAPVATDDRRATNWGDRTRTVDGRTGDRRTLEGRTTEGRAGDGRTGGWTRTRNGWTAPVVSGTDRRRGDGNWDGTRDGRDGRDGRWRDGRNGDSRWSNDWRRDRRYDWRDYRSRNHSIFRLGRYYDPFGYGYQRLSIGFTLFSGYYQSNYWLSDPYQYRLPPVYGPYRWVRYYDDAVLVDIYSGEVVDVIQGFFW